MVKTYCTVAGLLFCWGLCAYDNEKNDYSPIIDLAESTHIVRALIVQEKIAEILEDYDPKKLVLLLNNASPAHIAFEIEILGATESLVVVYFYQENETALYFIEQLKQFAHAHDKDIKYAKIDMEQLPVLSRDLNISEPVLLLIKEHSIIEQIDSSDISIEKLQETLARWIFTNDHKNT